SYSSGSAPRLTGPKLRDGSPNVRTSLPMSRRGSGSSPQPRPDLGPVGGTVKQRRQSCELLFSNLLLAETGNSCKRAFVATAVPGADDSRSRFGSESEWPSLTRDSTGCGRVRFSSILAMPWNPYRDEWAAANGSRVPGWICCSELGRDPSEYRMIACWKDDENNRLQSETISAAS